MTKGLLEPDSSIGTLNLRIVMLTTYIGKSLDPTTFCPYYQLMVDIPMDWIYGDYPLTAAEMSRIIGDSVVNALPGFVQTTIMCDSSPISQIAGENADG